MNITDILERYETLADSILKLLQEERSCLKAGKSTDECFDQKRDLIDKLTDTVAQVRAYRDSTREDISFVKDRLTYVQQRLMKILQLDREVEKLFLGNSVRPQVPEWVPAASRVGKAYQAVASPHP